MTSIPEFIDTYSDDLLYLIDLRDSHLTHPGKKVYQPLFQASIARIFCAFMVGNIEAMIKHMEAKDVNSILAPYFANSSNRDRIDSLKRNFELNGIEVDGHILEKYLAIKCVRNTIIHSKWNENQKDFILEMGFPTDTRSLTNNHLQIMYSVNSEMIRYIAAIEHKVFSEIKINTELPEPKKYFTKQQLSGFLWNNLERIDNEISIGSEVTENMVEETIFDWNLFKVNTLNGHVDFNILDYHIDILQKIVDNKKYSSVPIGYLNLSIIKQNCVNDAETLNVLEKIFNLNSKELIPFIEALSQGKVCHNSLINISVLSLLRKLNKLITIKTNNSINNELQLAEKLFRLGRLYYDYAEKR